MINTGERKNSSSAIVFSLFSPSYPLTGLNFSNGASVARRWVFATGKKKLKSNWDVQLKVKSFKLKCSAETSCGFNFNEALK